MSDFVKRLREVWEWHRENEYTDHTLLRQSADLIEQQQKEIERLKGHLDGHEKLASRGIYYTMDEIRQHDSEVAARAVYEASKEIPAWDCSCEVWLRDRARQRVQELEAAIGHSIRDMEYAAFNLCESMNLDSENGGRTVETTCPEK